MLLASVQRCVCVSVVLLLLLSSACVVRCSPEVAASGSLALASTLIDLHTHTTNSDGTLTPLSLVRAAAEAGVTTLGWTDHDQLAFAPEVVAEAERLGVTLVKGVEISVEWRLWTLQRTVKAHLLGYWVRDDEDSELFRVLSELRESRHTRNLAIIDRLRSQHVTVTPQQLLQQKMSNEEGQAGASQQSASPADASSAPRLDYVGRPHFARVLVQQGVVPDIKEAFNRYLADDKLDGTGGEWSVPIDRAISALHAHGGISVLAHPSTLGLNLSSLRAELTHLMRDLRLPLTGLEAFSSRHTAGLAAEYAALADELGLVVTGGSDFHGKNKANTPLAVMGGGHGAWSSRGMLELDRLVSQKERLMSRDEFAALLSNIAWHLSTYCALLGSLLTGAYVFTKDKSSPLQAAMQRFAPTRWLYAEREEQGAAASLEEKLSDGHSSDALPALPASAPSSPPVAVSLSSMSTPLHFLFCFVGLQLSYLSWGYLQERIMTGGYDNGFLREEFVLSEFLVFSNRAFAVVIAGAFLALRGRGHKDSSASSGSAGRQLQQQDRLVDREEKAKLLPDAEQQSRPLSRTVSSEAAAAPVARSASSLSCPPYKYMLCSLTNILSSWLQYESLHFISFPLQVLSKSSKILFTMLMGRLVSRLQYSLFSYLQAALIAVGLLMFRFSEMHNDFHRAMPALASELGIVLLLGYMLADSFTSTWQRRIFDEHPAVDELEMMVGTNLFSSLFTLGILLAYDQLLPSLAFALHHPDFALHCLLMSFFAALGQLFIFHTISAFGAVAFASIMTLRQLGSLVLSLIAFGHPIGLDGIVGLILVFFSLGLKIREDVSQSAEKAARKRAAKAATAAGEMQASRK